MSTSKKDIWHADPHTLAKIAILKNYLRAWFPIVGKSFPGPILYIDGFAGPGYYLNSEEGSPVAAYETIKNIYLRDGDKIRSNCNLVFIEKEKKLFEKLNETIGAKKKYPRIDIHLMNASFDEAMYNLIESTKYEQSFHNAQPLLIFADPFGATGVPFEIIKKCFKSETTELLLNFDADGVERIRKGQNENWEQQLDEIFGDRSWEREISNSSSLTDGANKALKLYEKKLKELSGLDYVWAFEMRGKNDKINYFLLFASKNILGMKKMKEAMTALDKTGDFTFSDAHYNQLNLFDKNSYMDYANHLHEYFRGQHADMFTIEKFVLCNTPYTSCKTLLQQLSRRELVKVHPKSGFTLMAHSFPEEKIQSVEFLIKQSSFEQQTLF